MSTEPHISSVVWGDDDSRDDFMAQFLHKKTLAIAANYKLSLTISSHFVTTLFRDSRPMQNSVETVLHEAEVAPIQRVIVDGTWTYDEDVTLDNYTKIVTAAGKNTNLEELYFKYNLGNAEKVHAALQCMPNISILTIHYFVSTDQLEVLIDEHSRIIASGLSGHEKLENVTFCMTTDLSFYLLIPHLLPVLPTMPRLTKLTLANTQQPVPVISLQACKAIASLLQLDAPNLVVELESFHFATNSGRCRILCNAIASAGVKGISLRYCKIHNLDMLVNALQLSKIKTLSLFAWQVRDFLCPFLAMLAQSLPNMSLERLELDHHRHVLKFDDVLRNVAAIVRAAPSCITLKSLQIPYSGQRGAASAKLARALVACVRSESQLEEIVMHCPADKTSSEGNDVFAGLAEAMKNNYYIKRFTFQYDYAVPSETIFPCNLQTQSLIDAITRMNSSGRIYVKLDPANKRAGVDVLDSVSNSLDGLFIHLLENPSLCARDDVNHESNWIVSWE
ncbi:hypothetical protein MPSEU_000177300 [Mayamaea pseudoterrestris]|nr:hypothetical protein MPSEU_000177300 [Mayamaea pseudoterrestris]